MGYTSLPLHLCNHMKDPSASHCEKIEFGYKPHISARLLDCFAKVKAIEQCIPLVTDPGVFFWRVRICMLESKCTARCGICPAIPTRSNIKCHNDIGSNSALRKPQCQRVIWVCS